ncbi:substrate-binding periplasmic protein [Alteromonas antoniana]|uniref:substrate-binding periplasmic protein n=1 Tax=Alteromonas antoniana TaxID=2803813 RepID=UPI001C4413B3
MASKCKKLGYAMVLILGTSNAFAANIRAVTELFSPFQMYDASGSLTGCATELVRQLVQETGDSLTIDVMPWSLAYQYAVSTPGTFIFSIGRNEQREPLFHWIGNIARENLYFWTLSNSGIAKGEDILAFRDYRIAVVKDATTHQYLSNQGFQNLYLMSSTESNIDESSRVRMLLKGRADIMIASSDHMQNAIASLGMPERSLQVVYRAKELDTNLNFAISAPADEQMVAEYQIAFQQLNAPKKIQQCVNQWQ